MKTPMIGTCNVVGYHHARTGDREDARRTHRSDFARKKLVARPKVMADEANDSVGLSPSGMLPKGRKATNRETLTVEYLTNFLKATLRWAWFGLLVLVGFAFLASGLSENLPHTSESSAPKSVVVPVSAGTREAIERVDARLRESLAAKGLQSAPRADWMTISRRISLALVGNGLSLEEIRHLEAIPETDRVTRHLESLLTDRRFHDYWAERWTRFLVGTDEGPFIVYRRRRFRTWLADQFEANRKYDEIVRSLVTANGLWTDKPEVNFLTVTYDSGDSKPDPIRLAARTSRAFLGLRIDCLQCHDDFLGNVSLGDCESPRGGVQQDFHQLAAFYTAAKANGLQGIRSGDVDYQYKYLDADEETTVDASVPYSPELLPSDGDPRERLATWITHPDNRQAARAAVSRVLALMFGRAAGDAVDDLPLGQESTPLVESLTDEFLRGGRDLRQLIRVIVGSQAFQVDSQADFEILPEHEDASAVFPLVRLRPEQTAGCVIQSTRIKSFDEESSLILQLLKFGATNDFLVQYGDIGEDEFGNDAVTITQRLVLLNGKMVDEHVLSNPILNASSHISRFAKSDSKAIETVYLTVLNRYPSTTESEHFVRRLNEAKNRQTSIEDLYWVLINSSEFSWNH